MVNSLQVKTALPLGVRKTRSFTGLGSLKPPGRTTRLLKSSKPGTTREIRSRIVP